ncbi:MAG: hypothetical protein K0R51_1505 [Cytophagaceae bacterium]|jgi:hypothetical protein|nr:hypothetical protein [Cytophagaceae bacterium]
MKKIILSSLILSFVLLVSSCKRNDDDAPTPQDQNEEELITTVSLIIKENGVLVDTFSFKDSDGVGGEAPTIEDITLDANKTYTCTLLLLDETKNPVENISEEIEEENDEHQFFFHPSAGTNLTVNYLDFDDNNVPVGLETELVTGAASSGTFRVVLKHQPGVKPTTGDTGNEALGETDVEVEFDVTIQ